MKEIWTGSAIRKNLEPTRALAGWQMFKYKSNYVHTHIWARDADDHFIDCLRVGESRTQASAGVRIHVQQMSKRLESEIAC